MRPFVWTAVTFALGASLACGASMPAAPEPPSRLRRLSAREVGNVYHDLVGERLPDASLPEETYDTGYDNGSRTLTMQTDEAAALERAASAMAEAAVARHRDRLVGACVPERDGAACAAVLLDGFAVRAFRRPLAVAERSRFVALFDAASASGGPLVALEVLTAAVLESGPLLYREELGGADGTRLTPSEAASALAFFLTGTMPDDALAAAAHDGRLATGEDRRREGARLLATPSARDDLRAFVFAWLGLDGVATMAKDPGVYPAYGPALGAAMKRELARDVDAALFSGDGSLGQLFGSSVTTIDDDALAALYGVSPGTDVLLDPGTRRGVLTRAGFLTAHAGADSSNPVARGVFVRSALLCAPPPAPPPNIPRTVAKAKGRTTRERFDDHTRAPFCQSCHDAIDGAGFAFEEFDGIGRLRTEENGVPIDASGWLRGTGVDGSFVGATALEDRLLATGRFADCVARQVFRFAMGRGETAADQHAIDALAGGLTPGRRFTDALLDFAASDAFVAREKRP
jgi:hypothetical protein